MLFKNTDTYLVKTQDAARAERVNRELGTLNEMLYDWSVSSGQMRANPQQTRRRFLMVVGGVAAVLIGLAGISTFMLFGFEPVLLVGIGSLFIGVGAYTLLTSIHTRTYSGILFGGVWLVGSMISFSTSFDGHIISTLFRSPMIVVPILAVAIYYVYRKIGMFTPKGLATYRHLLGYRDFMKHVEQDRIRRFLTKDPSYLDRGLPYAVLFGLNTHWLSFYEALDVPPPAWYDGDIRHINTFRDRVASQTTPPPSESGGFSGGGSFAGGGGGGGGVGSW